MRRRTKRPTIREVAQSADVSIGTVSNVLNGTGRVRATTRAAVERAIVELGYRPNIIARSLITRRSRQAVPPAAAGPKLTTVGYLSVDYTARVDALPQRDDRITASGIEKSLGGPAANVAVTAAGLGGKWAVQCELVTVLGNDADSEWAAGELAARDVEVIGVRGANRRLSRCIVLVEPDGRRTIVNEPLVIHEANVVGCLGQRPESGRRHCVHLDGYQVASMTASMSQIRKLGFTASVHTTGLHRDWRSIDAFRRLRSDFDLVFLNRDVARDVLGFSGSDRELLRRVAAICARTVPEAGPGLVLLTLGAAGAALFGNHGEPLLCSAPRTETIDTTGAGDTFAGVFLATWLNHEPLATALSHAVTAASHSITAEGAQGLHITAQDLLRWEGRVTENVQEAARGRP